MVAMGRVRTESSVVAGNRPCRAPRRILGAPRRPPHPSVLRPALAAARALMETDFDAEKIARKAMAIAADICVFTNGNLTVETIRK